jgi:hypothetical protein
MASDGRHPWFDDGRAVRWHTRLADALEEARTSNRRVFVCWGGARCTGTRHLVERVITKSEIADFLNQHFVALACDAEHADPELARMHASLARREPTPVAMYLDAEGHLRHSTAGGRPAAVLLNDMQEALFNKPSR